MTEQNYIGYLLASHPRRRDPLLVKGVMLIIDHTPERAIGLQLNKTYDDSVTVETVMNNVGLHIDEDRPLYNGGPTAPNRVYLVHSLDWFSSSTININGQVGVSNDVSILSAIAANQGPEYFRVIAGCVQWAPQQLDNEMNIQRITDISSSWSPVRATVENIFEKDGLDQWQHITSEATKMHIANWL